MNINWKWFLNRVAAVKPDWKWKINLGTFGTRTIAQRLVMLLVVLISGFVLVAAAYWGVVELNSKADTTNETVSEFGFLVDRVEAGVLQARREEKDFFAKREDSYVTKVDKALTKVYEDIAKAKSLAPDDEARTLLGEVKTNVEVYQGTFHGAAEAQQRAGHDENTGLFAELREAEREVGRLLERTPRLDLTASLLTMRRIESDFLQRGDAKFIEEMSAERDRFAKLLARSDIPPNVKAGVTEKMKQYHSAFLGMTDSYREVVDESAAFNEAVQKVEPILASLLAKKSEALAENRSSKISVTRVLTWSFAGALLLITGIVSALVFITSRSITHPLDKLTNTIGAIASGDREARVKLATGDEMQELGDALDKMMDERGKFMQTEQENERLNNSVISILRSVSQLGKGDLTVRVPVHEDITGALGDAINQMSESMGKTLGHVSRTSEQVVVTSRQTREITTQSRETVLGTARGMNEIRATIQETAKRIKRLGERSQEIGGIVKLIDTIAERTNMLALNANMQAAQAGEAGRGFMVVAAEVQRLAESAKEATDQIAKLVNAIQSETGATIAAMDEAIEEVVEGSELAEQAATQINRNQEMVSMLDALGKELLDAVRAFKVPEEATSAGGSVKSIKAVA